MRARTAARTAAFARSELRRARLRGNTFAVSRSVPAAVCDAHADDDPFQLLQTVGLYGWANWLPTLLVQQGAELFPTRARATGVGFTYSWSRLSAAVSSLVIGALLVHGVGAVVLLISGAWLGVALIIGLLGPTTNALPLEVISS